MKSRPAPPLLELLFVVLLGAFFIKAFWGHPATVEYAGADAGKVFWQVGYYIFFYLLLFSFSRTVSVKNLYNWFYLGLAILPFAVFWTQKWVASWNLGWTRYFHYYVGGDWKDIKSMNHFVFTGPLVEETYKALPLVLFFLITWRRGLLRSYTLSDWLLMGAAVGLGYFAAEDMLWIQESHRPIFSNPESWPHGFLDFIAPVLYPGQQKFYLGNKAISYVSGSHPIWTAYVGFSLGLAAFLARQKAWLWKILALLVPPLFWAWAVLDHGLGNLTMDSFTGMTKAPEVAALCMISLGGRIPNYGFLVLLFAVAGFEFFKIHRSKPNVAAVLRLIGRYAQTTLRVIGATFVAAWGAYLRAVVKNFAWRRVLCFPLFLIFFIFLLLNQVLKYLVTEWQFTRLRHSLLWGEA